MNLSQNLLNQKNTIKDPNNTYIVKWFEAIKEILKEINKKESK